MRWFSPRRSFLLAGLLAILLRAISAAAGESTAALQPRAFPRIVNGVATVAYPSAGILLMYDDASRSSLSGFCSGTLVGCRTFVTAAHCVCPSGADQDAASCLRSGLVAPATLQVFLQHAGLFDVTATQIDPEFNFAVAGDVALVTLAAPVTGVTPMAINTGHKPPPGTRGTIAGFGVTSSGRRTTVDAGIKREGKVTLATCIGDVPDDTQLCWQFTGPDASTCDGDSGGPLLVDFGDGALLAGITSGGESKTCLAPDMGFDTDVFTVQTWIADHAADLGPSSCGDLPPVGGTGAVVSQTAGTMSTAIPEAQFAFTVPTGATRLRVALNGQIESGSGLSITSNDFDLFVRSGSPPTDAAFDCSDENPTTFGFCEFDAPTAGPWYVVVRRIDGDGSYQLVASTFTGAARACLGDCDGDGRVEANELVTGYGISAGNVAMATCPVFDGNMDSTVTDDELLAAVHNAFNGCPP